MKNQDRPVFLIYATEAIYAIYMGLNAPATMPNLRLLLH